MSINRREFLDNYLQETSDNLQDMDAAAIGLRKAPQDSETLSVLLRVLHSIKGTSRMMQFHVIESLAHGLEDIFRGVRDERFPMSMPLVQLLLATRGYIGRALDRIRSSESDDIPVKRLMLIFQKAMVGLPFDLDELDEERNEIERAVEASGEDDEVEDDESVRIRISRVDEIIRKLNGLIIQQFQFKKENESIRLMDGHLRNLRIRMGLLAEKYPQLRELDELSLEISRQLQRIDKNFGEEMVQLEHSSFELQEMIHGLRMLPMEIIMGPLHGMIEETALALGKEVDFTSSGTQILLDKAILEQINDPVIHLIRNSIDHGIESPAEREAAGKPRGGRIGIACSSESGRLHLAISDDGRGLNFPAIRSLAKSRYPDSAGEIDGMEDANLVRYLFDSGFTTRKEVTSLSGRGVGLDIVRSNIEAVKGKITVESKAGEGTTFHLSLPLSLSTVSGFFVSAGKERFLIPSAFVREILIVPRTQVIEMLSRNVIRVRNQMIPVYPLTAVLDNDSSSNQEKLSVVVVESMGDIIGIIVDSVIQFASLIYKPLPGHLARLKVLQGVVFDENFNIITILYIPELIDRFKGVRNIELRRRYSPEEKTFKRILVVDDSMSTREIETSILQLDGYAVEQAVDGIDALEKMRDQYFHLIVTDLSMPRMDGLTLIENIRRQEKFADTPIVVVSSEAGGESLAKLQQAGANAAFNKKDFDRGSLLDSVRRLIG